MPGLTVWRFASTAGDFDGAERKSTNNDWAGLIRRGQRDGSIRPDVDAAASAVVLHGMLRGVAALLLTESEYTDMTSVRATVDAWIAGALGQPA